MTVPSKTPEEQLEFYKALARERGGECLSDEYLNNKAKLRWRCAKGHEWEALPTNIKRGHWCQICGNHRQGRQKAKSIEAIQELARAKGGAFLSSEHTNNRTKLHWRCVKGHEWMAESSAIQQGAWCPIWSEYQVSGSGLGVSGSGLALTHYENDTTGLHSSAHLEYQGQVLH